MNLLSEKNLAKSFVAMTFMFMVLMLLHVARELNNSQTVQTTRQVSDSVVFDNSLLTSHHKPLSIRTDSSGQFTIPGQYPRSPSLSTSLDNYVKPPSVPKGNIVDPSSQKIPVPGASTGSLSSRTAQAFGDQHTRSTAKSLANGNETAACKRPGEHLGEWAVVR